MNSDELTTIIDDALDDAEKLKLMYQRQKMTLSWKDYKKVIEGFLQNCFNNCKLIEDYEKDSKYCGIYDFMNEDNFYISYFCKSLETYMQNYEKAYYGLKRGRDKNFKRCKLCGALFDKNHNRKVYCDNCKEIMRLERYRKYNQKRQPQLEN